MRILLAEDDDFLAGGIALALRDSGYAVDHVKTGPDADLAVSVTSYDLMVLDLGLPKLDGTAVLQRLRGRGQSTPVLILTARDSLGDRVGGLDLGANDYMTKPFELPELEARIRALIRKDAWSNQVTVQCGDLTFDTVERRAFCHGSPLDLSAREVAVLELLLQRLGKLVSKRSLAEHLSSWEIDVTFNALEIIVYRLRRKLGGSGVTIRTARGLGYIVESSDSQLDS